LQKIKNQILEEYQESKKDRQHYEARKRFQYLHEKLSHIKRLVVEYDKAHST
jgi:RNA polymerase II elongation factor ELL